MAIRKLKDKNNNDYIVEVDKNSFQKGIKNKQPYWSAEFSVKDANGKQVGFGSFNVICLSKHKHLKDRKMFKYLATKGTMGIKKLVDEGRQIESVGYTMRITNCRK